ncbi:MAG: glycoside hydrolase family 15 protein, partial [Dermatophilaceae bacterium]
MPPLLDRQRGGRFRIAPAEGGYVSKQRYFPGSAVLITRFMAAGGVGEVIDFMPVPDPTRPTDNHRLVRMVRVVRGQMRFRVECMPRFDYGRADHTLELTEDGARFRAKGLDLTLHTARLLTFDQDDVRARHPHGDGIEVSATAKAGEVGGVMLETAADGPPRRLTAAEITSLFDDTVAFWRRWLGRSTYRGRWREQVARSAMTLKLMTYAPSGALVAAPTAGLPEQLGGERNWDYRFTWIRDASFSVYALLGLGYAEEARAFLRWLADRVQEQVGVGSGPLKIMYRVDGSSDLAEQTLGHLEGYRGSAPVRIGNGASDQLQLDIYGEAIDSIYFAHRHGTSIPHQGWARLSGILDWLSEHWDAPDEGVWETRGGRQDFVYGRINSWTAFDRAIRLAADTGRPGNVARWLTERDHIYRQVMDRGWHDKRAAFVQHYATDVLDAALLRMV